MADEGKTLKKILQHMTGFRFAPGKLLDSESDTILVVSRIAQMHPSRRPYDFVTEDMVHDKLLEMMDNCHAVRHLMYGSNRMERLLWEDVQMRTSWTHTIPTRIIRRLALKLAQAAWKNVQSPLRNNKGEALPYCRLAIASVRFAREIFLLNFYELRAPAMRANDRAVVDGSGNAVTIPVFPLRNFGKDFGLRWGTTEVWETSGAEPGWFKKLKRV